jgi:UBX domain-containing protein 1/4
MTTDKLEDAKAKNAIRAQIEADKRARAEKVAREKALREGNPFPDASTSTSPSTVSPTSPTTATSPAGGVAGKDYKETRLQIRLASGGQPYTTTLPSDSSACSGIFKSVC